MADLDPLDREPLHVLLGPTASGKTALALELCERAGAEVLSLDSMQVYRGMDIGTAKPSAAELGRAPHHLIDLVAPEQRYDVQRYLTDARAALSDVLDRGRRGLFVGGTGLYLAALLRGLFDGPGVDEELRAAIEGRAEELGPEGLHAQLTSVDPGTAAHLHANDRRRVVRALEVFEQTGRTLSSWQQEWGAEPSARQRRARLVGLELPDSVLDERIRSRAASMLDAGWAAEAAAIRAGSGFGASAGQALGYQEALALADGELGRAEAERSIARRTRRFARRQRTWYRKFDIHWLAADDADLVHDTLVALGWD